MVVCLLAKNTSGTVKYTQSGGAWTNIVLNNYISSHGGYTRSGGVNPYLYDSGSYSFNLDAVPDGSDPFIGWYTIPSNVTRNGYLPTAGDASQLISTGKTLSSSTIQFYAHYVKFSITDTATKYVVYPMFGMVAFTITFNPNGGEAGPKTQTVYSGSSVTLVSTYPGRSGYKFKGWSKSSSATTATYNAGGTYQWTEFSDNPTLYAVWAVAIIVIYDPNGGTVTRAFDRLAKGETFPTLPTATYGSETTKRWYTAASGGTEIKSGSTVTQTSDFTLYAHWSSPPPTPVTTHTLYYEANGGSVSPKSKTLNDGAAYGTLPTPTRSGYTFQGWFTEIYGGSQVSASTTIGSDDVTIYAHWNDPKYTITFNPNGGSVSETSRTISIGNQMQGLPTPWKKDSTFDGWYTVASGGTKITESTIPTGNMTVYAHWKAGAYDLWDVVVS